MEKDITSFILDRGTGQDIPGMPPTSTQATFVNSVQMLPNISISVAVMSQMMGSRRLRRTTIE